MTRVVPPAALAAALALLITLPIAQGVYRIPIQVGDGIDAILEATRHPSFVQLIRESGEMSSTTFRPMRYAQSNWLLAASRQTGWSYHAMFRGLHAALLLSLALLFVLAARVRSRTDLAAFGLAFTVFAGIHTFSAMLHEAYPVNHFVEIAVATLAVLVVAQQRPRWYGPLVVCALLAYNLMLVESAVLIWLVTVACFAVRLRGISLASVMASTLVLAVYAWGRHELGITPPGIGGHGSGYGTEFYSPEALVERFGDAPLGFMAYNVIGALGSTLFSEPRTGIYFLLRAWNSGTISPVTIINVTSSVMATAAIAWYAVRRLPRRFSQWSEHDKLFVVAAAAIGANAVLAAAYIKDEIISVGGVFYALAVYVAARAIVGSAGPGRRVMRAALVLAFVAGASLWAFRAAGVNFMLRQAAFKIRNDWAQQVLRPDERDEWPSGDDLELTRDMRREVISRSVTSPSFLPSWGGRYWTE